MRKLLLTSFLLLVLAPSLAVNGNSVMAVMQNRIAVRNQSELSNQVGEAIRNRIQAHLEVNDTLISVLNNSLEINATKARDRIKITARELRIDGLDLLNDSPEIPANIRARIKTKLGNASVNIIRVRNQLRIEQDNASGVQVQLNHQIRVENNTLILNKSGVDKVLTVLPTQAMNQLRATNQTIESFNLTIEGDRAIYQVKEKRNARLFGFIPVNLSVESTIDATTAELVNRRRPWWSFLTTE